jgi:hypothetical protein
MFFNRGTRPSMTMMSQNSHWKGHPRENWSGDGGVGGEVHQIQTRRGGFRHVGLFFRRVGRLGAAGRPIRQKSRPGELRLINDQSVRVITAVFGAGGGEGPAKYNIFTPGLGPRRRREKRFPLRQHSRKENRVGPIQIRIGQRADVHVHQPQLVFRRGQSRHGHQAQRGQQGFFPDQRQGVLQTPHGGLKPGVHQEETTSAGHKGKFNI